MQDGKCYTHLFQTCAICLEDVKPTDKRLKCKHRFHPKCIMKWFEESIECPTCRMEQDDDPIVMFKLSVEDALREKYKDAIKSLQEELRAARS